MNLLLGFTPFLLFAVICHSWGVFPGLVAGALSSVVLIGRDLLAGRSAKILEAGTAAIFALLAVYTLVADVEWSIMAVRLTVDIGLLLIVIASILAGQPFSGQYARESVQPAYWDSPKFRSVNRQISGVWAMALAVIVCADMLLLFMPQLPHALSIGLTVAALAGAAKFTSAKAG